MHYFFTLITFLLSFSFSISQIELVLEEDFNHNLHHFLYSTQSNLIGDIQLTKERVFLRVNNQKIVYVDEENQQLSTAVEVSNSVINKYTAAVDDGMYYTINNGSNSGSFKLCMIDNNLEVHEYFLHDYNMWINLSSHGFFFQQVGTNIIFFIEDNQSKRLFKFNTQTKITEQIIEYPKVFELNLHTVDQQGILFSRILNTGREISYVNKEGEVNVLISNNEDIQNVSWIKNNDPDNFYVSFKYENNKDSVFRFNNESLEKQFFSTALITSLSFNSNRILGTYFHSNTFIGEVQNDTLVTIHRPTPIKSTHPTNYAYYGPRLIHPELELFTYSTPDAGFELFKINEFDSLDILNDLNQGRGHGIPIDGCYQINSPPDRLITHNNEVFLNMTNGNDPNVYLYKITSNSLEPVLKLKDYNPGRIRYFSFKDHLYYFVYHPETRKNRLYKVKWDEMNDAQPQEIEFESETWATETSTVGINQVCQSQSGNYITPQGIHHDNENNIYISQNFRNYWNKYVAFERRNKFYYTDSLSNIYLKYTPYGELKWVNNIGEKYKSIFAKPDKFLIDNENNLQVYGAFHKKAFFDGDSLKTVGSARFYAKLDGETGAVLENKVLYETDYIDDVRFDQLIKGERNYLYLAGSYRNFNQNFGDTSLISFWNHQSFLAKYDSNGNLVWIRNVLNNWNDFNGEINNIEYIEQSNEIVVFSSQNRIWCNDGTWRAELIFYDTNGNEKTRKDFRGYNRHTKGKVASLDKRYFLIKGSINESISAGVYEFSNQNDIECTKTYDYQIIYDRNQNKFISANISDSLAAINIKRVIKESDYIYYFGNRVNGGDIVIQRFLNDGTYKGEKVLNQNVDLRLIDISYRDGFFVLAMQDAKPDNFLKINPIFKEAQNVLNIARFQITEWDYLQSYSPMDVQFVEEDLTLFAYPNPTIGKVQINFKDENKKLESYRILNLSGQVLHEDKIPNQNFIQIDLTNYQNGLYFIQFEGSGKREVIKIIKQP